MAKMVAKWLKLISYLWPKRLKNHTLWNSRYKGEPPPPGAYVVDRKIETQFIAERQYLEHVIKLNIFALDFYFGRGVS